MNADIKAVKKALRVLARVKTWKPEYDEILASVAAKLRGTDANDGSEKKKTASKSRTGSSKTSE